ncbi:hypothetical protein QJS04_geneDACA004286 [Acorus gramineus]|uniref:Mediator complex subunit 15 KIX domain-containing protein n=1 Tax=Acorus gramineus TaxID=55184 RepID=A0AAV9B1W0_ACOGR|nr:hypothetical protein QJS04_geneDACA004286 [Acorus gramineus]
MKRYLLPISGGPEGMIELKNMAVRFEEETYVVATSQEDYLRRISLEMLRLMDTRNPGGANHVPPNAGRRSQNPPDLVRRRAPKRRIPQTASTSVILHIPQHTTNAARHLYPILEQGITIEAAQRLAQDVIHYLENGIPLPAADAASM